MPCYVRLGNRMRDRHVFIRRPVMVAVPIPGSDRLVSVKKRLVILALGLAAAGAGGYYYLRPLYEQPSDGDGLVLYGNIDIREADLAFNVGGRIESMLVEEGDVVERGQVLATLDDSLYRAEVESAEAQVAAQQASLDRLLAGSRPEEIKKARADVAAIESSLDAARASLQRTEKLAQQNFASQQRLDDDRYRVSSLEAELTAAQQSLSLAIQGPRDEDIAEARAKLAVQQAALNLAQQKLGYTRLAASETGTVKTRIVEPGVVVLAQSPVYTVALTDPVWVRTYVAEPDLGRVAPGTRAKVYTDTDPSTPHEGWVGFVSPVAEFTPRTVQTEEIRTSLVYRLRVYVENTDNGLRQGMPVTVRLEPERPPAPAGDMPQTTQ